MGGSPSAPSPSPPNSTQHHQPPRPPQAGGSSSSSGSDPALFLRILQAEKEGFLSYTIDAPGANQEDREDGYGRRGTTEWEEARAKLERFYQPPSSELLEPEAMVRAGGCGLLWGLCGVVWVG